MSRHLLRRLARDTRGVSAVEFGLLALPFCFLLMGSFDIAYQAYVRAAAQGAVETLTRAITIQGADENDATADLKATIQKVASKADVAIERGSVSRFSQFGAMERLTLDANNNGVLDKSDCWEDVDNNGIRNTVSVGANSIGGADDIVRYNVTVTYDRLFPIWKMIGVTDKATVSAATLIRRQPYEAQAPAPIRCKG